MYPINHYLRQEGHPAETALRNTPYLIIKSREKNVQQNQAPAMCACVRVCVPSGGWPRRVGFAARACRACTDESALRSSHVTMTSRTTKTATVWRRCQLRALICRRRPEAETARPERGPEVRQTTCRRRPAETDGLEETSRTEASDRDRHGTDFLLNTTQTIQMNKSTRSLTTLNNSLYPIETTASQIIECRFISNAMLLKSTL